MKKEMKKLSAEQLKQVNGGATYVVIPPVNFPPVTTPVIPHIPYLPAHW